MADSYNELLKASEGSWALGRAIRYAIATAVFALLLTAFLSGAGAERLASTAYVALIFTVLALVVQRLLPSAKSTGSAAARPPPFAASLTFLLVVGGLVTAGAALVSEPAAEGAAILACFALIGAISFVRSGGAAVFHARVVRSGALSATKTYAALAIVVGLLLAAILPSGSGEGFVKLAYFALVLAALAVGIALGADKPATLRIRARFASGVSLLRSPAGAWVFGRTATYAIVTAIASIVATTFLPHPYAERFATTAYIATILAALAAATRWSLRGAADGESEPQRSLRGFVRLAADAVMLSVAGAALVFNPLGAGLVILACVIAVGMAIGIRSGAIALPASPPVQVVEPIPIRPRRPAFRVPRLNIRQLPISRLRPGTARRVERAIRYIVAVGVVAIVLTAILPKEYAYWSVRIAFAAMILATVALVVECFIQPPSNKSARG